MKIDYTEKAKYKEQGQNLGNFILIVTLIIVIIIGLNK